MAGIQDLRYGIRQFPAGVASAALGVMGLLTGMLAVTGTFGEVLGLKTPERPRHPRCPGGTADGSQGFCIGPPIRFVGVWISRLVRHWE